MQILFRILCVQTKSNLRNRQLTIDNLAGNGHVHQDATKRARLSREGDSNIFAVDINLPNMVMTTFMLLMVSGITWVIACNNVFISVSNVDSW